MTAEVVQIVELDQERDRKTCVTLDLKVTGANRELAQWCIDHPRYTQRVIAGWLQCSPSRIFYLRAWASAGFEGSPFERNNKADDRARHDLVTPHDQTPLQTNDNPVPDNTDDNDDDKMAPPAQIEEHLLYTMDRSNENARVFIKLVRASAFDREAVARIDTAIERMIQKWRSIQSTLGKKKG